MNDLADICIVLSHELDEKFDLSKQTKERVIRGIELFSQKQCKILLFSGGYAYGTQKPSLAQKMKEFAVQQGIAEGKIITEEKSLDTVGQAIFTKEIIKTRKANRLMVVTHDYHIDRTKEIFKFVYGPKYQITYSSIQSVNDELENETKSIQTFRKTFNGVKEADDDAIMKRLKQQHELYKN